MLLLVLSDPDSISQSPFQWLATFSEEENDLKCGQMAFSSSLSQGITK